ncbi:unnamed protein product [Auanema sp. JU1783]|nr:unnamed protein product [Auanema sp. JU1783]
MDGGAVDLLSLLPEVQDALRDDFDGIECSIGPGPVLSQSPFRMPFKHIGRQVVYVPDLSVSCLEDFDSDVYQRIQLTKNSAIFTDGLSGGCLEIVLDRGKDWKQPLIRLFNRLYPGKWAFFVVELEQGQASFHLLCSDYPPSSTRREDTPDSTEQSSQVSSPTESVSESSTNYSLWITPITQIFAIPPPKKVKIIKRVVKKKTGEGLEPGSLPTSSQSPVTTIIGEDGKEKKVRIVKKIVKKEKTPEKENTVSSSTNTVKEANDYPSDFITPVVSSTSSDSCRVVSASSSTSTVKPEKENSPLGSILAARAAEVIEPSKKLNMHSNDVSSTTSRTSRLSSAGPSSYRIDDDDDDDKSIQELRRKLSAGQQGAEEKFQVNGEILASRRLSAPVTGLRQSLSRKSITPDKRLDPIYEGPGRKERCISPAKTVQQECVFRSNGVLDSLGITPIIQTKPSGSGGLPYVALQAVLGNGYFSYEELGNLRLVHPHWDEVAGQTLNAGYYKLLKRSDNLLMSLQRRLPSDPTLQYPTTVLTNIQVHILNSVDIMRTVLDEGVCCFPYGVILDRTFHLLNLIELMLKGGIGLDDVKIDWQSVASLAKKASLHYRTKLEKVMEERMGENLRLKAAQRIIRLDSFMVESTVSKLEKDQLKSRDDLKWEIEQLQQQNTQLRRVRTN